MAAGKDKDGDFYAVLGLNKQCSPSELRNAYKKLALRWHPDRCSASGNAKFLEESKKKFQAIQEAYSVLSDSNKRFMYDVGVYDSDDDDDGMGDFLGEMAFMMNQSKPNQGNRQESFEDLQDLFEEMFQRDMKVFGSSSHSDKRNFSEMNVERDGHSDFSNFQADSLNMRTFCLGAEGGADQGKSDGSSRGRKSGRKQKVSSAHSHNTKISA